MCTPYQQISCQQLSTLPAQLLKCLTLPNQQYMTYVYRTVGNWLHKFQK